MELMRSTAFTILTLAMLLTTACGPKATTAEECYSTPFTLPDGAVIRVENMRNQQEMMRGMMFRDELKSDRGNGPATKRPQYGGNAEALFVVELAAGVAVSTF